MDDTLTVQALVGAEALPFIPDLATLRITVFREFPYLYDGSPEYEERYLRTYVESPESLVVVAAARGRVVGASTGVPLEYETDDVKAPFLSSGIDTGRIFYFGESVLLGDYRGRGMGVRFFHEREAYARRLGRFTHTAFCAVERPGDHPRRPKGYAPLDAFWMRRGYARQPGMRTSMTWKDLDEDADSPKPMVFWMKNLGGGMSRP